MGLLNVFSDPYRLILPVTPTPKARPRLTKNGRTYTPKETKAAEGEIAYYLKCLWKNKAFEEPIKILLEFHLQRPKSVSKKKRPLPSVKPDIDNYAKLVLDACNGVIYKDDSQITTLFLQKRYSDKPKIVMLVEKENPSCDEEGFR